MRVAILTGSRFGSASRCLEELVRHPGIEVTLIIHALSHFSTRRKKILRDLRKIVRIGPLGALNGIRMRAWYRNSPGPDIYELAGTHGIPIHTSPRTNADESRLLLAQSGAELGLSLNNGYIAPSVFSVLKHGMLNVHGEILPDFRGAASVVWPIYEGRTETGFTIHQVSDWIDAGVILYQERYPIILRPTLAETVHATVTETARRIPPALANVIEDYPTFLRDARPQSGGVDYTTPTFPQFVRMLRNHRRMWRKAQARGEVLN